MAAARSGEKERVVAVVKKLDPDKRMDVVALLPPKSQAFFPEYRRERAGHPQRTESIRLQRLSKQVVADFQNCIVSIDYDSCVVHKHIQVIRGVREFTRRSCDAVNVSNIYFQKCRVAAFLCDFLRRFATSLGVSRADEHVKSFRRELSRDFVANAFVRAGNQHGFHVLFIGSVRIIGLQKIL